MQDGQIPPLPDFDLEAFTPYRLAVAAKRASDAFARQYRDRFGITVPEWRILVHLAHSGEVSVRDIEARVALEKYEISRTAKRLEEAGLIHKKANASDRRLVALSLAPKGRAMMAELLPLAQAHQEEMQRQLGDSFAQLEAGLTTLLAARS